MKADVLKWMVQGETGISSKAMAAAVCDIEPDGQWAEFGNHPSDPSDLDRCIKFLAAVPLARFHLAKVAKLSKVWAALIDNWQELETLYALEQPTGKAPMTYARMKELGC